MCLYYELSDILFENCEKINDGMYIKCMELLKQNYNNKNSYIFVNFLLKNKEKIDNDVLTLLFTIILQDLDKIQIGDKIKKKNEKENKKNFIHDFTMFISLTQVHLGFIYMIYVIYNFN